MKKQKCKHILGHLEIIDKENKITKCSDCGKEFKEDNNLVISFILSLEKLESLKQNLSKLERADKK